MITDNLKNALEQSEANFKQWTENCIDDLVSSQQKYDLEVKECNATLMALKDITALQDTKNNILLPELQQVEKDAALEKQALVEMERNMSQQRSSKDRATNDAMRAVKLYQHLGKIMQ